MSGSRSRSPTVVSSGLFIFPVSFKSKPRPVMGQGEKAECAGDLELLFVQKSVHGAPQDSAAFP